VAVDVDVDGGGSSSGGGGGGCGDGSSAGDHLAGSVAKFGLSLSFGGGSAGGSSGSAVVGRDVGGDDDDDCCCCSCCCSVFTSHVVGVWSSTASSLVVHSLSSPAVQNKSQINYCFVNYSREQPYMHVLKRFRASRNVRIRVTVIKRFDSVCAFY
jgi:hypothetical protein